MKIKESDARAMLMGAGMASAESWNAKKLLKNLNHLVMVQDELTEPEDKEQKGLLSSVFKALENGEEIEMEEDVEDTQDHDEQDEETPAPAKGKKKGGKAGAKTNGKATAKAAAGKEKANGKPAKEKKEKADRDRFGSRKGTASAAVNALLTAKARPMQWFIEKTGNNQAKNQLRTLVKKGFAEKTEDGYVLAAKQPAMA